MSVDWVAGWCGIRSRVSKEPLPVKQLVAISPLLARIMQDESVLIERVFVDRPKAMLIKLLEHAIEDNLLCIQLLGGILNE
ncbi:TPA: hypothetical protein L5629_005196 [Pseudomonas aeruginosa]|nr:hypothetical protein [Pseudomonas aeruginosa]